MHTPATTGLNSAPHLPPVVASEPNSTIAVLEDEIDQLASALAARFEELTLIHDLSQSLTLGEESSSIVETLLDELRPCTSASSLAILLEPDDTSNGEASMHVVGETVEMDWLNELAIRAEEISEEVSGGSRSISIVNRLAIDYDKFVRIVVVPIDRRNQLLGRMIAIRTADQPEFGTTEGDLMRSTSMMLGVHLINQRQFLELQQMFEGTIQSLVSALDAKDAYTCGHSTRVSELTVELAKRLDYGDEGISRVRMGGILHDIGKIGVDDAVLCKPGKLTEEEFDQIKQHPVLGYEILKGIRQFSHILPAVRHHHESWDGTGYPDGLAGDDIPRDAQIMAVADAFDAMTSDRPYRSGMCLEKVISIFQSGRGSQWAADVVDTLLGMPEVMERYAHKESDK
ncbi:HD-GYP domain-containing protein [Planctomycetes bacterium K23_9]|uniref:Cyclic di-GMP phosphodiesterase response regulator RpfG n=1 Tax=Stieleria marina TaxID=1930275 RepID=A0A517NRS4_9BACT|nr:Cyclic di-GMP phosphodiesterase response regulator RpfG [Planctomycetes bacterium K23_9]